MSNPRPEPFYGGIMSFEFDPESQDIIEAQGVDINPPTPETFVLEEEDKIDAVTDLSDRPNAGLVGIAYTDYWVASDPDETTHVVSIWADFNRDEWWTMDEGEVERPEKRD